LSRRKDLERFQRAKAQNPNYAGFRGLKTQPEKPADVLETVVCTICNRKRNVAVSGLPDDRSSFVCLSCQDDQEAAVVASNE